MRLAALALALLLGGCSTVGMFAAQDAVTAQAIAAATPYTAADAQCFLMWGAVANAIGGPVGGPAPKIGVMATIELKRAALLLLMSPPCLPISAMLANDLLKIAGGPAGGLIP